MSTIRENFLLLPDKLIIYQIHADFSSSKFNRQDNLKKTKDRTSDISDQSYRKLCFACNLLNMISVKKTDRSFKTNKKFSWKLNFIRLSLTQPQANITDHFVKNTLMTNFIKQIKYKDNLKSYVWKAEPQGNGNIHIHLVTDTYIHYSRIRYVWNMLLYKYNLMGNYIDNHSSFDANSTDVKALWSPASISKYFNKYFKKKNDKKDDNGKDYGERRKITGRVWGCSDNLHYNNRYNIFETDFCNDLWNVSNRYFESEIKHTDYCVIVNVNMNQFYNKLNNDSRELLFTYIKAVRDNDSEKIKKIMGLNSLNNLN